MPGSVHTNNSNSTANDKVSPLIPPPPTNSQPNIIAQPQSPAPSTKSSVFSPKQSNDINKNHSINPAASIIIATTDSTTFQFTTIEKIHS